ncbi:MAG TPA: hypothetical protein VM658_07050 [bacterium]|nr:hypothetical protein [bacterium]
MELAGEIGRGEDNALARAIRDAGLASVLAALPADAGMFLKAVLASRLPRPGQRLVPADSPMLAVPGLVPFIPHSGQVKVLSSAARFKCLCTGRRWGKSRLAMNVMRWHGLTHPGATCWLVVPIFSQGERVFHNLCASLPAPIVRRVSHSKLTMTLNNNAVLEVKSGDDVDHLRGQGIDLLVCDEAGLLPEEAWTKILRPSLSDTRGTAWLISTPRGRGSWFYRLFLEGQDADCPDVESWSFPSWGNVHVYPGGIIDSEIGALRRSLPHDAFKQEIEAVFLQDGGTVFRNLAGVLDGPSIPESVMPVEVMAPVAGMRYFMGLDLGRYGDFTVATVMDSHGRLCYFDRWTGQEWGRQRARVKAIADKYHDAEIIADETGMGQPVTESLKEMELKVRGFTFTSKSKQDLIADLTIAVEQRRITLARIPVLTRELEAFSYDILPSGNTRFSAPSGLHDDAVCSLALAYHGLHKKDIPWSAVKMGMNCQPRKERVNITDPRIILDDERL